MDSLCQSTGTWKEKLLRNYRRLVHDTDLYDVVDDCFSEGVFSGEDKEKVDSKNTSYEKNREFLKILLQSSEAAFNQFLECLTEGHTWIKDLITNTKATEPSLRTTLSTDHHVSTSDLKRKVFRNFANVVSITALKPLTDDFITERIFEIDDWETITTNTRSTAEENRRFLNILLQKETLGLQTLLSKLRENGHSDLVTQIEGTDVTDDVDREIEVHLRKYEGNISCVPNNIRGINEEITNTWKTENDVFIETNATKKVVDFIVKNNVLTVTGNAGTGKSATIHHVGLELKNKGYEVFLVHSPAEMNTYLDVSRNQLFIVDDPVGVHSLDKQKYDLWIQYNQNFQSLSKGNTKFLCSIRNQVANEPNFKEEKSILNVNIINLQEYALNGEEKYLMLKKHLEINNGDVKIMKEVERNAWGTLEYFPLICRLFSSNKKFQGLGFEFFQIPFAIILRELDLLEHGDKSKYCTLVMCFAFENNLDPDLFDPFTSSGNAISDSFMTACGVSKHEFVGNLLGNLTSLLGVYLKREGETYHFSHDLIHDVVAFHFGQRYQQQMLKFSPSRFICERVVVKKEAECKNEYVIEIKLKHFQFLLDRLLDDLDKKVYNHVLKNKCWDDEQFIKFFIKYIELNKDRCLQLFLKRINHKLSYIDQIRADIESLSKGDIAQVWSWFYIAADLLQIPNITLVHWIAVYAHRMLFKILWEKFSLTERQAINQEVPLLCYSCLDGDIEICSSILHDTDCDVNNPCTYKDSLFGEKHVCEYWPLQLAAMKGVSVTNYLLRNGADIDASIQNGARAGRTAVTWAAGFGNLDTVSFLIEKGANINSGYMSGHNALYCSAQNNHTQVVQLLLSQNASVNIQNDDGWTALMVASLNGHTEVVKLLLGQNASIDMQDNEGWTSLMLASLKGHSDVIQILLQNKANTGIRDSDGWTAFMIASKNGYTDVVKLLLSNNTSLDAQNNNGWTALMIASEKGHIEIVKCLCSQNVSVDMQNNDGLTALMIASQMGHVEIVKVLLAHNACVDMQDNNKGTALILASRNGHSEVLQQLLRHNASVNMQNNDGWTALMLASQNDVARSVKLLLSHNASTEIKGNGGWTALMKASQRGYIDVVQLLLSHNASLDIENNGGWTSLMMASHSGHTGVVRLLLIQNANFDKQDNGGWTALMQASHSGHCEIVKLLLNHNAKIDAQNNIGWTSLMLASQGGHCEIVKHLLNHSAIIDIKDNNGWTALMIASKNGHLEIIKLLLSHDASVNAQNNNGWTALMIASQNGHTAIVELFFKYNDIAEIKSNDGLTALMIAAQNGHSEVVQVLLSHNAIADMQNKNGLTALMMAANTGHANIIKLLLRHKVNVNQCESDGCTALMFAAHKGHTESLQLLLDQNISVNAVDSGGWTALMLASQSGHTVVVQRLLSHFASIDTHNASGWTSLMLASHGGHTDVVDVLLTHNASINKKDKDGCTALMQASHNSHEKVVQLLLSHNANVDIQNNGGLTSLMFASRGGHTEVVKLLLGHNAHVNIEDSCGWTALKLASQYGHTEVVYLLLSHDAIIDKEDKDK